MIDHMGIRVSDVAAAKSFYDAAFAALGGGMKMEVPKEYTGGKVLMGYGRERAVYWVGEGKATSPQHIAFSAQSRAEVDAFHTAALAAGGRTMARRVCGRSIAPTTMPRLFSIPKATISRRSATPPHSCA